MKNESSGAEARAMPFFPMAPQPCLQAKSIARLTAYILGLSFLSDLAKVKAEAPLNPHDCVTAEP